MHHLSRTTCNVNEYEVSHRLPGKSNVGSARELARTSLAYVGRTLSPFVVPLLLGTDNLRFAVHVTNHAALTDLEQASALASASNICHVSREIGFA